MAFTYEKIIYNLTNRLRYFNKSRGFKKLYFK